MNRSEEILTALKKKEKDAFEIFFSEYYEGLVLFATGILKDVNVAEDIVQECFVNVWEKQRYEQLTDGLEYYMFHIVKNAALNELRGIQRRISRHEKAFKEREIVEEMRDDDDIQSEIAMLYAAIWQLPPERRCIFMMICAEGMKYQEVADRLQISINTVRTQMGRAVKFLRDKLKNRIVSIVLLSLLFHK